MVVWVASYPRSGNTLFRMLLFYLYGEKTYSIYPEPEFRRLSAADTVGHAPLPAPLPQLAADSRVYFVKTHELPRNDWPTIYLVRDGRDSLVSHTHFWMAFRNAHPWRRRLKRVLGGSEFERTLSRFIRTDDPFNGWSHHVLAWTVDRVHGATVPVRYEDLVQQPEVCLREALTKLDLTLKETGQRLPSFDALHAQWPDLFRRGQVGSWRDEMPERLHDMFWRRHAIAMRHFGYAVDAPAALIPVSPPRFGQRGTTRWDRELEETAQRNGRLDPPAVPTVSMASLGRHGLWGNTVFQYAFLKTFARQHGLRVEVPGWLGQHFYRHDDQPMTRKYPVVVRDHMSMVYDDANYPTRVIDAAPNRVLNIVESGRAVWWLRQPLLAAEEVRLPFEHFDLEGLFMIHSRHLAPHRDDIRSLFKPTAELDAKLQRAVGQLRARGKTVIGVHLRRGDFDRLFIDQGWQFVAPMRWYVNWLEQLWRDVADPVLLICSNNLAAVVPHFAKFKPVTVHDLGVDFPELARLAVPSGHPQKSGEFFPEWHLLSQCDAVATSNSTFSFTASMLNERARRFVRPNLYEQRLTRFEPWNAEPLLFLPHRATLLSECSQQVRVTYEGLGSRLALRAARVAQHRYRMILRHRALVCRRRFGLRGLAQELTQPAFYLAARRRYGDPSESRRVVWTEL
ncbi:MAG TPA: sulfotransferase domain-containing protein [Candidatus Kryptonia bacterium]|nr:sulfotransferase domain-containing protein [Candidatus Kryptonia bacterium]